MKTSYKRHYRFEEKIKICKEWIKAMSDGESQKLYCKKVDINHVTLRNWLKKYRSILEECFTQHGINPDIRYVSKAHNKAEQEALALHFITRARYSTVEQFCEYWLIGKSMIKSYTKLFIEKLEAGGINGWDILDAEEAGDMLRLVQKYNSTGKLSSFERDRFFYLCLKEKNELDEDAWQRAAIKVAGYAQWRSKPPKSFRIPIRAEYLFDEDIEQRMVKNMQTGQRIKELRKMHGYSLKQFGEALNLPVYHLQNIEDGQSDIFVSTIERMAGLFGITITQLFEGVVYANEYYPMDNDPLRTRLIVKKAENNTL